MKNKLKDNIFAAVITAAVIAAVVLANIVLYSLTAINGWGIVYAEELDLTISGNTDALFKEAIEDGRQVEIIFCMPEDELAVHETGKDVLNTAKQFEERYPGFIDLKFYNIRTMQDDEGNVIKDRFEKYKTDKYTGEEQQLHKGSVIFSSTYVDEAGVAYPEEYTVLTATYSGVSFVDFYHIDSEGYVTAYNGEEIIASRVLWTLAFEHKTAYFTTGHGESVDVTFANILISAGYNIKMLDLVRNDLYSAAAEAEKLDGNRVSQGLNIDEAAMVIISNPTADFSKGDSVRAEIDKLEDYLSTYGGALYVSLDPYVGKLKNLEGLLEKYGMKISESTDDTGKSIKNIIKDSSNAITTDGYTFVANYADNNAGKSMADKTENFVSDDVVVKNMGAIEVSGIAQPVLIASSSASLLANGERVDSKGEYCVAAVSEQLASNGNTSRIFLTSGVYMTASDAIISDSYANRNFVYAVLDVFFDASVAPYGCRLVPYSTGVLEDLTMGRARAYTALIMLVPVILAVVGIIVNKRRKNR